MAFKSAQQKYNEQLSILESQLEHQQMLKSSNANQKSINENILKIKNNMNDLKNSFKGKKVDNHFLKSIVNMKQRANYSDSSGKLIAKNAKTDNSYVILFIRSSQGSTQAQVNTKAVENGLNITTNTQMGINQITLDATIGGMGANLDDVQKQLNKLKYWANHGNELVYHSPEFNSESVQITDYEPSFEVTGGGTGTNSVNVSLTLNETSFFDVGSIKKATKHKAVGHRGKKHGKKSKKKHFVKAKSGFTYIYVARIKGVSLKRVMKLNHYSATKIPIGAKIYY